LASLPAINTSLVVFDTKVIDLTEQLDDPTDVLFSVRLGGGTDITAPWPTVSNSCARHKTPSCSISDLFEGGVENEFPEARQRFAGVLVCSSSRCWLER